MLIARAKAASALYLPLIYLAVIGLSLGAAPRDPGGRVLLWAVRGVLLAVTLAQARFVRRRGDRIAVARLFRVREVEVTERTRITARLAVIGSPAVKAIVRFVFRVGVPDDDGAALELGSALGFGTLPESMGRSLAATLAVPLDAQAPGARAEPASAPPTQPGGWAWAGRHPTAIALTLALAGLLLLLSRGVERRGRPAIAMPCAGQGFRARLEDGASVRIDGAISGYVNPGAHAIAVWDGARNCWARRDVMIEPGHALRVTCDWVIASPTCTASAF
jgi:hypothetical protein